MVLVGYFGIAFLVALLVHRFLWCIVVVKSPSMEPTLVVSDRVLVSRLSYTFGAWPRVGDIVVLRRSEGGQTKGRSFMQSTRPRWLIKRVVATAGTAVVVEERRRPVTVPPCCVFVEGDNRLVSRDSREFGPVLIRQLIGKAVAIYRPVRRMQRL